MNRLREIHIEVDEASMAAFGWEDVPLEHGFHGYRQAHRWTPCPAARAEYLDRLLLENHRRAATASEHRGRRAMRGHENFGENSTLFD